MEVRDRSNAYFYVILRSFRSFFRRNPDGAIVATAKRERISRVSGCLHTKILIDGHAGLRVSNRDSAFSARSGFRLKKCFLCFFIKNAKYVRKICVCQTFVVPLQQILKYHKI